MANLVKFFKTSSFNFFNFFNFIIAILFFNFNNGLTVFKNILTNY